MELHKDRRFGIFQNCDHIFCIKCVQSWIMTGLCPICLKISPYVIPSEYWIEESDEKTLFFDSFVEKTPKKDYSKSSQIFIKSHMSQKDMKLPLTHFANKFPLFDCRKSNLIVEFQHTFYISRGRVGLYSIHYIIYR